MRHPLLPLLPFLLAALPLAAQTEVRPRIMVLVDTSGSMGFYFPDPAPFDFPPNGDYPGGDGSSFYTDQNLTNAFAYPGKRIAGTCAQADQSGCEGLKSRLWAAKRSLRRAIYGYGTIEFGLESFNFQLCPFNTPRCETCVIQCSPGCAFNCLYTTNNFSALTTVNWIAQAGCAGKLIQSPGANSGAAALRWLDGIEDHRTSGDGNNAWGTGSTPLNPELRADGGSPLAEAIDTARTAWYLPASGADPQAGCRPYRLVLVTDSAQSAACAGDPVAAATALRNAGVNTHVISLTPDAATRATHHAIASAGGTGAALPVSSAGELDAAFARIALDTILMERCNGSDDNCDGAVDEGFSAGTSCSAGVGICKTLGTRICAGDGLSAPCSAVPGSPQTEVCNGLDDDCDGFTDEGAVCQ